MAEGKCPSRYVLSRSTTWASLILVLISIVDVEDTYKVEDRMIPVNGAENLARIVIPTRRDNDKTETYPLMVWFHGGGKQMNQANEKTSTTDLFPTGFCLGSVDMDDYFLRKLSVQYRVVIVNIEYR